MRARSILPALSFVLAAACGNVTPPLADGPDPAGDGAAASDAAPADAGREGAPCTDPIACESGVCTAGACVEHLAVPCTDTAPPHASPEIVDVPIEFLDGAWTAPAACAWACDVGYCASGAACAANASDAGHTASSGNRWFGGDDRDLDGDGQPDLRSVGAGQSFVFEANAAVVAVGLAFDGPFRSATTGTAHATTVAIEVRNAAGAVIAGTAGTVPDTFGSGWIDWGLGVVLAPGTYVITAYVPGVFSGENYTASLRTDYAAGYAGGTAYIKQLSSSGPMASWTGWAPDTTADHPFRVITACPL